MEPLAEPMHTAWPFPFVPQDWEHTPAAVQAYVHTLQDELTRLRECVEALEARLKANSTTSHRPSSSDSPYKKPRQRTPASTPRKAGGKPGHAGHRQVLLPPTAVHDLRPEWCPCGNPTSLNLSQFVVGCRCCIASVSHKAVGQNVRCLIPPYAVQSAPDLLRRERRVDVAHPDTGERVHDRIRHGHRCRHRR
jgi:hypothetical protein